MVQTAASWYSYFCLIPCPDLLLTCDLLLMSGMWQEGCDFHGVTSLLESLSLGVFEKQVAMHPTTMGE